MNKCSRFILITLFVLCVLPIVSFAASAYTMTFDSNGGTISSWSTSPQASSSSSSTAVKYTISKGQAYNAVISKVPSVSRDGYTFDGWWYNTNVFELENGNLGNTYNLSSNGTFKAKWNPKSYSITYYDNGTKITGLSPTSHTTGTATTLATQPAKTDPNSGWAFDKKGWFTASDFSGSAITKIAAATYGNQSVYGKWTYTVSYGRAGANDPGTSWAGEPHVSLASAHQTMQENNRRLFPYTVEALFGCGDNEDGGTQGPAL